MEKNHSDVLLRLLAGGEFVTGEAMSKALGVSRMTIHKRMEALGREGVAFEARPKTGYRLLRPEDTLRAPLLQRGLETSWAGREMRCYQEVDSTNARCKALAMEGAPHGLLVLAEAQDEGRGRRGRGWASPPGLGLWSTLLVRPAASPAEASGLTLLTALAVCDAVQTCYGLEAGIKWPNDVLLGGKKLTGILLELSTDLEEIHWAVIGVGINVNHKKEDFLEEFRDLATSLALTLSREVPRAPLLRAYLAAFEGRYESWARKGFAPMMEDYAARSLTLGQEVRVLGASESQCFTGLARRVDETGALYVQREDGKEEKVLAGDVSVRGLLGYAK